MHVEISNYNSRLLSEKTILKNNTEARPFLLTWWSRLGIAKSTTAGWHCHYRAISTSSEWCRVHIRVLLWVESVDLAQWTTALWIEQYQYVCFRFRCCPYPRAGRLYPMPHSVGALNARYFTQRKAVKCHRPKQVQIKSETWAWHALRAWLVHNLTIHSNCPTHSPRRHDKDPRYNDRPEADTKKGFKYQNVLGKWSLLPANVVAATSHGLPLSLLCLFIKASFPVWFRKGYKNWAHLLPHWWGNQWRFVGFTQRENCRF